ncbi:hypothetical protein ALQ56_200158 [Pseudomonas syringae pv. papulans]|nr:hypothetical protein ALQ56_200158 [Pseudomonas syringae pv. papulans]
MHDAQPVTRGSVRFISSQRSTFGVLRYVGHACGHFVDGRRHLLGFSLLRVHRLLGQTDGGAQAGSYIRQLV